MYKRACIWAKITVQDLKSTLMRYGAQYPAIRSIRWWTPAAVPQEKQQDSLQRSCCCCCHQLFSEHHLGREPSHPSAECEHLALLQVQQTGSSDIARFNEWEVVSNTESKVSQPFAIVREYLLPSTSQRDVTGFWQPLCTHVCVTSYF